MLIKNWSISFIRATAIAAIIFCVFLSFVQNTQAATSPTIVLTVNGGSGTNVVNGDPVELGWYLDGPLTNCSITETSTNGSNIVVNINTTAMPSTGTQTVIPPSDTNTSYVLNCDELAEEVVVNTNTPTVTMSITQGTNLQTNNITGVVDIADINWSSQNATHCSFVWREKASAPGVFIVENTYLWNDYWGEETAAGTVRYDTNGPRTINETNTFYITCYNDNTGEEATASITLNVTDAPPPNPPVVNLWSPDYPSVTRSELYGYAYVDVSFNSANVTSCEQKAYHADGTPYLNQPGNIPGNPPGWGTSWWNLSRNFTNIQIATTTQFEVTCSRAAVTLAGVTYPATSTTKRILIEVVMPGSVGETLENWDRTTLPPVTASIVANPNPTIKNAITGKADTVATVSRGNASVCYRYAYYINGTPSNYADDTAYTLNGWNTGISGNGLSDFTVSLSTTTRLSVQCIREFDVAYGTAEEIANGTETADVVVEVQEAIESALPPKVYLYGNAFVADANLMWTSATERIGFNNRGGTPTYMENTSPGASSNSISFPFVHPYGTSGTYDIQLQFCDENDGESTFRVYTENDGLVGTYTTNSPTSPHPYCGNSYGTIFSKKLASGVNLNDGDIITVECDTPADGERCRLAKVLFGAGDGGTIATPQVNPIVTSIDLPLLWLSENTTNCGGVGELGHWAYPITGPRYSWWANNASSVRGPNYEYGFVISPVSTSTTFTLTCWRTGDSETDQSSVQVYVPFSTTLSATTIVGSGQCIDNGSFGNFGANMTAPPGYGPDVDGWCSPLIDLAATSPAVSIAGATDDNINGTYDNLNVLIAIENLGPGELITDSKVAYKATLEFLPIYGLPTIDSLIGHFTAGIAAPVDADNPTQSPTLTRTFDGVPFGTHTVCSRVNLDGSPNFPESSADVTNNTSCTTVTLPVPRPPMTLSADRKIIRKGQSVVLDWSAHTSYPLNCEVRGPGGINDTFDASANYPNPPKSGTAYTNSQTSLPLTSTGEYTLQCTEPITNTTFVEKIRVEVTPDYQEI